MDSSAPSYRKLYSAEQIQLYYERIGFPQNLRNKDVARFARTAEGLEFLTTLQKYQLAAVPSENLELHYSSHHTITLDPDHLFHKIVGQNKGRGGYCMEDTSLFGTVLKSLGFDVMTTGARINEAIEPVSGKKNWPGPRYNGCSSKQESHAAFGYHRRKKYLVDVGTGATGATAPLPLIHDEVSPNIGPQDKRLVYDSIPDVTDSNQKLWVYQHRNGKEKPWTPTYCFQETEFLPRDFLVMNHFTSTHPTSIFTYNLICTKLIMEDEVIVGNITLFNGDLKKRINGKTEHVASLTSEGERVAALKTYFGITLSQAEKDGIKGMLTEL
ncbi:Arylamine N-acetyltransferase [Lachnellula suecica]|uniref:Arylamine N-acetyltransferase n=1 Tax=Lachnellula suecica TaxID=602035 RepID=A0A8T9CJV0_9HELO|nr:Arylamine N-acetyltransferase [Lachnellula suecica]